MLLSHLLPAKIDRLKQPVQTPTLQNPQVSKKMTIIEAPARYRDLPVELPQRDYRPSQPQPDPITLPGHILSILVGDDFIFPQPTPNQDKDSDDRFILNVRV